MLSFKLRGDLHLVLRDMKTGKIKYEEKKHNLIVTAGASEIAKLVANSGGARPTAMAVGTSTTAPSVGQTDLVASLVRKLNTGVSRSSNQITYTCLFATGVGTGAIQEAGLFTATTAGIMYARALTGLFNKASTDALTITWRLTFAT